MKKADTKPTADTEVEIGAGVDAPEQTDSEPVAAGPEMQGVVAARPGGIEADRKDLPANEYDVGGIREGEPRRDPASGAIITGEDEHGNALTTEAVARGAVPVSGGTRKRDHGDDDKDAE